MTSFPKAAWAETGYTARNHQRVVIKLRVVDDSDTYEDEVVKSMEMYSNDPVALLKEELGRSMKILSHNLRIVFEEVTLSDCSRPLDAYNIREGSTVHVIKLSPDMCIWIEPDWGRCFWLEVNSNSSVYDIKNMISKMSLRLEYQRQNNGAESNEERQNNGAEDTFPPAYRQRIFFSGMELEDDGTLAAYKIENKSILDVKFLEDLKEAGKPRDLDRQFYILEDLKNATNASDPAWSCPPFDNIIEYKDLPPKDLEIQTTKGTDNDDNECVALLGNGERENFHSEVLSSHCDSGLKEPQTCEPFNWDSAMSGNRINKESTFQESVPCGMQLLVRPLRGPTITLEVKRNAIISDVKKTIERKTKHPAHEQHLIYAGRQLEDGKTLADYNIQSGATLNMSAGLKGGIPEPKITHTMQGAKPRQKITLKMQGAKGPEVSLIMDRTTASYVNNIVDSQRTVRHFKPPRFSSPEKDPAGIIFAKLPGVAGARLEGQSKDRFGLEGGFIVYDWGCSYNEHLNSPIGSEKYAIHVAMDEVSECRSGRYCTVFLKRLWYFILELGAGPSLGRYMPRTKDRSLLMFLYDLGTNCLHGVFKVWSDDWNIEHPQIKLELTGSGSSLQYKEKPPKIISNIDGSVLLALPSNVTQHFKDLCELDHTSEETLKVELQEINDGLERWGRWATSAVKCHDSIAACPCENSKDSKSSRKCPWSLEKECLVKRAKQLQAAVFALREKCDGLDETSRPCKLANLLQKIVDASNKQASVRIFDSVNQKYKSSRTHLMLDLHFQPVSQAKEITKYYVDKFSKNYFVDTFTIITGRGKHSVDGRPIIKEEQTL